MQILSQSLPNLLQPFDMIPVEGGTFHMGDEHGDLNVDCRPVHKVKVSDFYIGKYPVTQGLWKAVMNDKNSARFEEDERPVNEVSWHNIAKKFLPILRQMTGLPYRLPTEAEWEYAARGGKYHAENYKYAGSDRLKDVGWFDQNSIVGPKPVGLKHPNQLGVFDMSGNVWEWCEDWYDGSYYKECKTIGIIENPCKSKKSSGRVARGGTFLYGPLYSRIAYRDFMLPRTRVFTLGFRLALSPQ